MSGLLSPPMLVALAASLSYLICVGHFHWIKLSHLPGDIDYASTYVNSRFNFHEVNFPVKGSTDDAVIHAWLITPVQNDNNEALPLVLMSHGLGSQKDMGLLQYAEKFADGGFAALMIDYRYFGGSTNSEYTNLRNLIDPWSHIADIQTVLDAVLEGHLGGRINPAQIVLWGTSFAGGHMLKIANGKAVQSIKGVISQVPHLDGRAASLKALQSRGPRGFLRAMLLAAADITLNQINILGRKLGFNLDLPAVYVKIVGTSEETAYMVLSASELKEYFAKHPKNYLGGWRNLAPARTLAFMSLYSPKTEVPTIKVPILFVAATQDSLCPIEFVRQAAETAPLGKLLEVNTTHFDLYRGENFERISTEMVAFAHSCVR